MLKRLGININPNSYIVINITDELKAKLTPSVETAKPTLPPAEQPSLPNPPSVFRELSVAEAQKLALESGTNTVVISQNTKLAANQTYENITFRITKSNISIDGNNAKIRLQPRKAGVYVESTDGSVIEGGSITNINFESSEGEAVAWYDKSIRDIRTTKDRSGAAVVVVNAKGRLVSGINVSGTGFAGIALIGVNDSIVTNNSVNGSAFGIMLDESSRNLIYNNNLLNNIRFGQKCSFGGCETTAIVINND